MGTALAQVLHDNERGPYLGKISPEQIDEINEEKHTNTYYDGFDENIKAYKELSEALDVDAVLCCSNQSYRLAAKQAPSNFWTTKLSCHGFKRIEPGTYERLSTILKKRFLGTVVTLLSDPVQVTLRNYRSSDITLITKQHLWSWSGTLCPRHFRNNHFAYTNSDVMVLKQLAF